ncbi:MAG TPA: toxin glutamine deamidase domain-containing protein, partial [Kineosporiaceae bacterium]|nr:toxin glutamine deamidase domain-containing protein [Kineosporiaceae bacterium]
MGLEVPPWAGQMFHVLTGDGWPAVDEDEINDLAQLWLAAGRELMRIAPEVTRSARWLADSGALVGDAQKALAQSVAVVTGDGDLALEKLAAAYGELGNYLHGVAVQTQYMKIIVIEQLIILAAQILYLLAMIPWTFGASAAGIAALQAFGWQFAGAVLKQLVIAVATGEVLQLGLDAIAQFAQIMERQTGHSIGRTEWDKNLTASAAITGAIGGALGPIMQGLGHYPTKALGHALGGVLGKNAGHEAGEWLGETIKGGVHEWVTDGTSGLAQDHKWTPDTFSTTAGAIDEGVSGLAGMGGRKGGSRYYKGLLPGGAGVPDTNIHIPDHLSIDPTATGNGTTEAASALTPVGPPTGDRPPTGSRPPAGDRPPTGDRSPAGERSPAGDQSPAGDLPPRRTSTRGGTATPGGTSTPAGVPAPTRSSAPAARQGQSADGGAQPVRRNTPAQAAPPAAAGPARNDTPTPVTNRGGGSFAGPGATTTGAGGPTTSTPGDGGSVLGKRGRDAGGPTDSVAEPAPVRRRTADPTATGPATSTPGDGGSVLGKRGQDTGAPTDSVAEPAPVRRRTADPAVPTGTVETPQTIDQILRGQANPLPAPASALGVAPVADPAGAAPVAADLAGAAQAGVAPVAGDPVVRQGSVEQPGVAPVADPAVAAVSAGAAPVAPVQVEAPRSVASTDGGTPVDGPRPSAAGAQTGSRQPAGGPAPGTVAGDRTVTLSEATGLPGLGVDRGVPASIAEVIGQRVEQRLAESGAESGNPVVDRLTTAGAVQEVLGGLAPRDLTPSEQTALADSLGQLNETVFRDVAQAGEFRAPEGTSALDDLPPELRALQAQANAAGARTPDKGLASIAEDAAPVVDIPALGSGLPAQVVTALQGLSPVVTDLAGSGADPGAVARQLDLLRDAVIDGATAQALPGVDGRVLVQAREDLATLWDGYLAEVPQEGTETLVPLWSQVLEGTRTGSLPEHLGSMVDQLGGAMASTLRDQVQQAAQTSTAQASTVQSPGTQTPGTQSPATPSSGSQSSTAQGEQGAAEPVRALVERRAAAAAAQQAQAITTDEPVTRRSSSMPAPGTAGEQARELVGIGERSDSTVVRSETGPVDPGAVAGAGEGIGAGEGLTRPVSGDFSGSSQGWSDGESVDGTSTAALPAPVADLIEELGRHEGFPADVVDEARQQLGELFRSTTGAPSELVTRVAVAAALGTAAAPGLAETLTRRDLVNLRNAENALAQVHDQLQQVEDRLQQVNDQLRGRGLSRADRQALRVQQRELGAELAYLQADHAQTEADLQETQLPRQDLADRQGALRAALQEARYLAAAEIMRLGEQRIAEREPAGDAAGNVRAADQITLLTEGTAAALVELARATEPGASPARSGAGEVAGDGRAALTGPVVAALRDVVRDTLDTIVGEPSEQVSRPDFARRLVRDALGGEAFNRLAGESWNSLAGLVQRAQFESPERRAQTYQELGEQADALLGPLRDQLTALQSPPAPQEVGRASEAVTVDGATAGLRSEAVADQASGAGRGQSVEEHAPGVASPVSATAVEQTGTSEPGAAAAGNAVDAAAVHSVESVLPSVLPPALRADVVAEVRAALDGAAGRDLGAPLARLVAADVVDGMRAETGRFSSREQWVALAHASEVLRQGVVADLSALGRERSAQDAARERESDQAAAEARGRSGRRSRVGRKPAALVRGLPGDLGHAVNGLAPLVQEVVAAGLPVELSARLLERMRGALVDGALAQVKRGRAARTPEQLRAELTRRWNEGPGVVRLADHGPWADTLAEARASGDLLRSQDGRAAAPTSVPVNAATTRVESFADAFAGVLGNTLEARASAKSDAGVSAAEAQLARDLALVNPTWDPATDSDYNCANVVQAYELRRRGFDVQARGLSDEQMRAGGSTADIGGVWGREFVTVEDRSGVDQAFAAPGSRGIVQVAPQPGAPAHVFNVENVDGQVRYLDAQRNISDASFLFVGAAVVSYLRLDDLPLPGSGIEEFAQPADPAARPLAPRPGGSSTSVWDELRRDDELRLWPVLGQFPQAVASAIPTSDLPARRALQVARQVAEILDQVPPEQRDVLLSRLVATDVLWTMLRSERGRMAATESAAIKSAQETLQTATFGDLVAQGEGRADTVQGLPPRLGQAVSSVVPLVERIVSSGLPADAASRMLDLVPLAIAEGAVAEARQFLRGVGRELDYVRGREFGFEVTTPWRAAPGFPGSTDGFDSGWAQTLTEARTAPAEGPGGAPQAAGENAAIRRARQYVQAVTDAFTRKVGTAPAAGPVVHETSPVSTTSEQAASDRTAAEPAVTRRRPLMRAQTPAPGVETVVVAPAQQFQVVSEGTVGDASAVAAGGLLAPGAVAPAGLAVVNGSVPLVLPRQQAGQVALRIGKTLGEIPAARRTPLLRRLAAGHALDEVLGSESSRQGAGRAGTLLSSARESLNTLIRQDLAALGQDRLGRDSNALPHLAMRGLPADVGHALAGLAPLVGQVVASGVSASSAARLLEGAREALIADAVTRAVQARGRNTAAGTSAAADGLRTDLRRWWNGLEGVLTDSRPVPPGARPGLQQAAQSWARTIEDSRRQPGTVAAAEQGQRSGADPATGRADEFAQVVAGLLGDRVVRGPDGALTTMPAGLASDLALTNPRRYARDAEYKGNCVLVTHALEVRRRGFDVRVRALTEDMADLQLPKTYAQVWGRDTIWVKDRQGVERAFEAMGPGARGFVETLYKDTPSHIFNVENVDGVVRFVDAQVNAPAATVAFEGATEVGYVRVDDLPLGRVADVLELAREPEAPMPGSDAMRNDAGHRVRVSPDGEVTGRVPAGMAVVSSATPLVLPSPLAVQLRQSVETSLAGLPPERRTPALEHLAAAATTREWVQELVRDQHEFELGNPGEVRVSWAFELKGLLETAGRALDSMITNDLGRQSTSAPATWRTADTDTRTSAGPGEASQISPALLRLWGRYSFAAREFNGVGPLAQAVLDGVPSLGTSARMLQALHEALSGPVNRSSDLRRAGFVRVAAAHVLDRMVADWVAGRGPEENARAAALSAALRDQMFRGLAELGSDRHVQADVAARARRMPGWPAQVQRAVAALPWFVDALVVTAPTIGLSAAVLESVREAVVEGTLAGVLPGADAGRVQALRTRLGQVWNQDAGPSWTQTLTEAEQTLSAPAPETGPAAGTGTTERFGVPANAATQRAQAFIDDLARTVAAVQTPPPGTRRADAGVPVALPPAEAQHLEAALTGIPGQEARPVAQREVVRRLLAAAALQDRVDVVPADRSLSTQAALAAALAQVNRAIVADLAAAGQSRMLGQSNLEVSEILRPRISPDTGQPTLRISDETGQAMLGLAPFVQDLLAANLPETTVARAVTVAREALVEQALTGPAAVGEPTQRRTARQLQSLRSDLTQWWSGAVGLPGTVFDGTRAETVAERGERGAAVDPLTQRADAFVQVLAGALAPHPVTSSYTMPDITQDDGSGGKITALSFMQRWDAEARLAGDVAQVNPWRAIGGAAARDNSVEVAQALELRRRGFDVQVRDPRTAPPVGSPASTSARALTQTLAQAWGRPFTTARSVARVQSAFRRMGHGARGVMVLDGNVSGSRVINVENVHGRVRFVDGRLNQVDARSAAREASRLSYLRVDDLPLGQLPSSVELVRAPGTQRQTGRDGQRQTDGPGTSASGNRSAAPSVAESSASGSESGAVSPAVADGLLGLGQQRLDAKDSRESTVSRAQDRPSLLVLTEGLTEAARQVAVAWPGVPAERSGVAAERSGVPAELLAGAQSGPEVAQRLREAAQQLALAQVRELAAGEGTRATLSSLVNDPAGPFGEATWAALAQRLDGPAGQSPAVRAAAVEETLAGVSRQFQAAVARWVPGYEWFRR